MIGCCCCWEHSYFRECFNSWFDGFAYFYSIVGSFSCPMCHGIACCFCFLFVVDVWSDLLLLLGLFIFSRVFQ